MTNYLLQLPTAATPNYSYTTNLDGVEYGFNFTYSTRNLVWYMTIKDRLDNILVSIITPSPHIDLMKPFVSESLPNGVLALLSESKFESPPKVTFENLSEDFSLIYSSE